MSVSYEQLLEVFGFSIDRDPFKSVNAAEERLFLPEYFVAPPFFESVWGNPKQPKTSIVFAPTGAGKTAQAIMLQERASSDEAARVLTLRYDDFERQGIRRLQDANLTNHLISLTRIATIALLGAIGTYSLGSLSFSSSEREEVQYLAKTYLGAATEEALIQSLRSIRSPLQKLSNSADAVVAAIPVLGTALKFLNIEPASSTVLGLQAAVKTIKNFSDKPEKVSTTSNSEWFDLERCLKSLLKFYTSIYIIIDRVDETSFTTRNANNAFTLISSLLTNLSILNPIDGNWAFKFFLWDGVQPLYEEQGRTDRIETHNVRWSSDQLTMMMNRRLSYYSSQRVLSLESLFDNSALLLGQDSIERLIVMFSNGSPRDSIRILQRIFSSYLDIINKDVTKYEDIIPRLPRDSVVNGIETFAKERFKELVPDAEMRRQMESIHRTTLTSTTLTTDVQKLTTNAANSKISSWRQSGAVIQVGDAMINQGGRPNRLYAFPDPRVALCTAGLGAEQFVREKLRKCPHCGEYQIRDWDLKGQVGQCINCQGVLETASNLAWQPNPINLRSARREIALALPSKDYVELITDDLGLNVEDFREKGYTVVEMMWKWVFDSCIQLGPRKLCELLNEVLQRTPEDSADGAILNLLDEAKIASDQN